MYSHVFNEKYFKLEGRNIYIYIYITIIMAWFDLLVK